MRSRRHRVRCLLLCRLHRLAHRGVDVMSTGEWMAYLVIEAARRPLAIVICIAVAAIFLWAALS
jgi:hypothetical protein